MCSIAYFQLGYILLASKSYLSWKRYTVRQMIYSLSDKDLFTVNDIFPIKFELKTAPIIASDNIIINNIDLPKLNNEESGYSKATELLVKHSSSSSFVIRKLKPSAIRDKLIKPIKDISQSNKPVAITTKESNKNLDRSYSGIIYKDNGSATDNDSPRFYPRVLSTNTLTSKKINVIDKTLLKLNSVVILPDESRKSGLTIKVNKNQPRKSFAIDDLLIKLDSIKNGINNNSSDIKNSRLEHILNRDDNEVGIEDIDIELIKSKLHEVLCNIIIRRTKK